MIGGGLEAGKNLQLFLTYDIEGTPFHTQTITLTPKAWNTITLETPYIIEDKEFYIGYAVTSGSNSKTCSPIEIDEGPASSYGDCYTR